VALLLVIATPTAEMVAVMVVALGLLMDGEGIAGTQQPLSGGWREGDVVGCLVDMDNRMVSFTLDGEGEPIGMVHVFIGEGFRPCGGVYACVSFNRREKLRLIFGGKCSEQFKFQPPGYRGVSEAILESVVELQNLVQREAELRGETTTMSPQNSCVIFLMVSMATS